MNELLNWVILISLPAGLVGLWGVRARAHSGSPVPLYKVIGADD